MTDYMIFDDMTWPKPGEKMGELEWRMRFGTPTKGDLLSAAAIIHAYRKMIFDTQKKRNMIIRELRRKKEEDING